MSYTVFHRESNDFTDILTDSVIKKAIRLKIRFKSYLIVDLDKDEHISYMMVKYGDDAISITHTIPDRSPIPFKDYVPERKHRKPKRLAEK